MEWGWNGVDFGWSVGEVRVDWGEVNVDLGWSWGVVEWR